MIGVIFWQNEFFKGVRHVVQTEPKGFMLNKNFQNGISRLKDYNLTYDILIYPHQLEEAIELVKKKSSLCSRSYCKTIHKKCSYGSCRIN